MKNRYSEVRIQNTEVRIQKLEHTQYAIRFHSGSWILTTGFYLNLRYTKYYIRFKKREDNINEKCGGFNGWRAGSKILAP